MVIAGLSGNFAFHQVARERLVVGDAEIGARRIGEITARILQDEGYIQGFRHVEEPAERAGQQARPLIRVFLKYGPHGEKVISGLERISRPGLRQYASPAEFKRVKNGLGLAILSTSRGVMTDKQAKQQNVGGEVLCYVA